MLQNLRNSNLNATCAEQHDKLEHTHTLAEKHTKVLVVFKKMIKALLTNASSSSSSCGTVIAETANNAHVYRFGQQPTGL